MLNQKSGNLSDVQIEIIDTLIGYNDGEKQRTKHVASQRLLAARRAIEAHREQKRLEKEASDTWFDEIYAE